MKITYDINGVRTRPLGVPKGYEDLGQLYRDQLEAKASDLGTPVGDLLKRLESDRVLERFQVTLPDALDAQQTADLIGVTPEGLAWILKQTRSKRHSGVMKWRHVAPCACAPGLYWGLDVVRLGDFLDQHGWERQPRLPVVVRAFKAHLTRALKVLKPAVVVETHPEPVVEPQPEPVVETQPEPVVVQEAPLSVAPAAVVDLPANFDEMFKMYGEYVFRQVRRASKIKTEDELQEVCQQVWCNLIAANVLGKFRETAATKLPRTLTLFEAVGILGITTKQWTDAAKMNVWLPKPVSGSFATNDLLYLTADIQTLDESGFLANERNVPRRTPDVTARGFKSYLAQAVKNHFLNMVRTRRRRHKERGLDPRTVLAADMSGTFRRMSNIEDATSWEENLTDEGSADVPMEDLVDFARQLRSQGVNPNTESGLGVLDSMTRGSTLKTAVRTQMRAQAA